LLAHSILHARHSRLVDLVVVSTDDDDIAAVATEYGATVVRRPAELASDEAASEPAVRHAVDHVRAEHGPLELVVFLQATSPIRQPGDLDGAIEQLRADGADSLFSACHLHGFVWRKDGGDLRSLTYDSRNRQRRQDLGGEDWQENGSFYVFKPWVLDDLGNRLGGRVTIWPMHPLDSFQVDEPGDLELMETLHALRANRPGAPVLDAVRLLVLDFDGVLTDNRVMVDEHGVEAVLCDRSDGWGIARLQEQGLPVVILSTERNGVVPARAAKLGVECVHGCTDKADAIREIAGRHGVGLHEIAFVANDVNDLGAMHLVGVPIAVADARPEVLAAAAAVTTRGGGRGAAREVCDWLLAARASSPGPGPG
jgi:N-acylneuraminate cytidylyltransferase